MILNNAPQNEAVLSNVGEIGEFRIRNSAKAFSILSSGLYANKIRAIVRELSCNAVDSHVAAGKSDTPFDVHLPSTLDPTFRIRDYGTGLTHEQVTQIYTTYFESTKTNSNEFIGALGLGSKSPFSYTDNFTVTAIRDGRRNVYSAFINGEGVPSIALMHGEDTTEPNGVEIQFAVTDRWDFDKFRQEARTVYTYFKLRPVVSGSDGAFSFRDIEYNDQDIIPGVHVHKDGHRSYAVMGNISYPIEIPNAESNLGALCNLINCGLEMHFDIGELDFQASREGLSYIPQTVNAIKRKLEALNSQLAVHIQQQADAFENDWDKAWFLQTKSREYLWRGAVEKYITDTQFKLVSADHGYVTTARIDINTKFFAKHNIAVHAFTKGSHSTVCTDLKPVKKALDKNHVRFVENWRFDVHPNTVVVINDTQKGALERTKNHFRNAHNAGVTLPGIKNSSYNVYVLSPIDKTKPMNLDQFYNRLQNFPESQRILASTMIEKVRNVATTQRASEVGILKIGFTDSYYRRDSDKVWTDAGRASGYDPKVTYYYIPLSGYATITGVDAKHLHGLLEECGITGLNDIEVYGVRKKDIEFIKTQKNWIDLEAHLTKTLPKLKPSQVLNLALSGIDKSNAFSYNKEIVAKITNAASPYLTLVNKFNGYTRTNNFNQRALDKLLARYAPGTDVEAMIKVVRDEMDAVRDRYPLLRQVRDYDIPVEAVVEYINIIDTTKGI